MNLRTQVWIYSARYVTSADIHVMLMRDEVCDERANSADHNQSNAAYCYRWRGCMVRVSVRVYIMEIITAKTAEPIEMPFGSDCPA